MARWLSAAGAVSLSAPISTSAPVLVIFGAEMLLAASVFFWATFVAVLAVSPAAFFSVSSTTPAVALSSGGFGSAKEKTEEKNSTPNQETNIKRFFCGKNRGTLAQRSRAYLSDLVEEVVFLLWQHLLLSLGSRQRLLLAQPQYGQGLRELLHGKDSRELCR